mmetsp:Transcript_37591/g.99932  ORF Transcript_37591/g.99932 Transcript_37591/m.99932 type:complete len:121 (-) Transcript_37591:214-576(-)|eukprot:CAMPEP_0194485360 /NCGR_PEP_ID=MMETSP0253-20130528/6398_1 /TAXON_ID=2966 /ORGANISM="Noctiluca scintillans" /LENGTH=120 /DNA_ID=CAMNT_0039325337 /DNA_START=66 /DNA_END=428 /DNA_ORIENTATION=-
MGSICCANPPRDRHETFTKNDTVEDSPELNLPAAAHDDTVDKGKSEEKAQEQAATRIQASLRGSKARKEVAGRVVQDMDPDIMNVDVASLSLSSKPLREAEAPIKFDVSEGLKCTASRYR